MTALRSLKSNRFSRQLDNISAHTSYLRAHFHAFIARNLKGNILKRQALFEPPNKAKRKLAYKFYG